MNVKQKWCICVILAIIMGIMTFYTVNSGKNSLEGIISIIYNAIEPRVPTDEDLNNLQQEMEDVVSYLEENKLEKAELQEMYEVVQSALVCSEANRDFNTLEEKYHEYVERSDEIQKQIAEIEQKYKEYLGMVDNIPSFSVGHRVRVQKFLDEIIGQVYIRICEQRDIYIFLKEKKLKTCTYLQKR